MRTPFALPPLTVWSVFEHYGVHFGVVFWCIEQVFDASIFLPFIFNCMWVCFYWFAEFQLHNITCKELTENKFWLE